MSNNMFCALLSIPIIISQTPTNAPRPRSTEQDIKNALFAKPVENNCGVLTFEKQMRRPVASGFAGMDLQRWTIRFDSQGHLRCKIVSDNPAAPAEGPPLSIIMFGRTPENSWLVINHELVVFDKAVIRNGAAVIEKETVRFDILNSFLRQASYEVNRALGLTESDADSQILMLDRDKNKPSAVIEIDGRTVHYEFERNSDSVLLRTSKTSDATTTYRSHYAGWRRENGKWIPSLVEGYRIFDSGSADPILFDRYSHIQYAPFLASDTQPQEEAFGIPQPGDPDIDFVITLVTTVSYDGVSHSTFGGTPVTTVQ